MALHEVAHRPKTLAESAICFGCSIAILAAAAVALQWVMHFV